MWVPGGWADGSKKVREPEDAWRYRGYLIETGG
jgi:hypothetical protein